MPNRESLKKLDYEMRQSKPELINLKRMLKNFKMKLCSITQLRKVKFQLNSLMLILNQKMILNLTKLLTFQCLLKMML
jgi:hypothetical protein